MKIYSSYMGQAWLLSKNGDELKVMNHPSIDFEFDSIIDLILDYGSDAIQHTADEYLASGDENLKTEIAEYYNDTWCKVRTWGTFGEEVTFRITSNDFNWYPVIVNFLESHTQFSRSLITVESYKSKVKHIFWNRIPYSEAVDRNNETILASKLNK